jgi:hypothetical protein
MIEDQPGHGAPSRPDDAWLSSLSATRQPGQPDALAEELRKVLQARQSQARQAGTDDLASLRERVLQATWRKRRERRWATAMPWLSAAAISGLALLLGVQIGSQYARPPATGPDTLLLISQGELATYRGTTSPQVVHDREPAVAASALARELLGLGMPLELRYSTSTATWVLEAEVNALTLDGAAAALRPLGLAVPSDGRLLVEFQATPSKATER